MNHSMPDYDVVIVGAGPNGLAAAIELSRNNQRVLVVEGHETIGGGSRTDELTLPGFRHDVCSTVFALGRASPFLKSLHLDRFGLEWAQPEIPVAHVLDEGSVALHRSVEETAAGLGVDGAGYRRLMDPLIANADAIYETILGPVVRIPPHPIAAARFGLRGLASAKRLAGRFDTTEARALLAGLAGHSTSDLTKPLTGAMALVMATAAHTEGYPFVRGGSQALADAMAALLESLGGEIATGTWIETLDQLPRASAYMLDVMPVSAAGIADNQIARKRARKLKKWPHGPATFKVDYATSAPIPWPDADVQRAGTVHVGGTFEEVAAAEGAAWGDRSTDRPFLILTQPTVADPSRAPSGKHTVWAYAHVANGSTEDVTDAITAQIERFAPGFKATILGQHSRSPGEFASYNPNNVGGDIGGGRFGLWTVVSRPRFSPNPYRIAPNIYLCSSATPPGAGVHGMNGFHAARSALRMLER